jgi:RNA polymerase-binding transcription factor DksA
MRTKMPSSWRMVCRHMRLCDTNKLLEVGNKHPVSGSEAHAMNQNTLQKYRRRLEALQDRLREDGTAVTNQARGLAGGETAGELSNVPLHLGDSGTEEFLQNMNMLLAANEGQLAEEVRDALLRVEQGSFGTCENCGQVIVKERLEALPFARYCVDCAEKMEGPTADAPSNFNAGRPKSPDDTLAPEGEMDEGSAAGDVHAAGTAGGGTFMGGLAGSNRDGGDPDIDDLQDATGSGNADAAQRYQRRRAREVQPVDYESDEDRERYEKKTRAVE